MSSVPRDDAERLTLSPVITETLSRFARRRTWLLSLRSLAIGTIALMVTMSVVVLCDYLWLLSTAVRTLLSLIAYGVSVIVGLRYGWHRRDKHNFEKIARQFESADPRFHEALLSTVELADPRSANGSPRFRQWLQDHTARRIARADVGRLLPIDLIRPWLTAAVIALVVATILMLVPKIQFGRRLARALLPTVTIERASLTQIQIIKPAPPDRHVAAGDAVGIEVRVAGGRWDTVRLQWQSGDGPIEDLTMTPRDSAEGVLVAVLPIGQQQVGYRVLAGDGVTLWHRLTPQPRPTAVGFSKRFDFPQYAQMAARTVVEDHGHIRAVAGTSVRLEVEFSEPCRDACLRMVGRKTTLPLEPIDQTNLRHAAALSLRAPARYHVDATSIESGLNNPFGRQFQITPVPDVPPIVLWQDNIPRQQIVGASSIVELAVRVTDDMPLEQVHQEIRINHRRARDRPLEIEAPSQSIMQRWSLNLVDLAAEPLSNGDLIQARAVAIDRAGQRSESDWLQILVGQGGIDRELLGRLDQYHKTIGQIIDWTNGVARRGESTAADESTADDRPPADAESTADVESTADAESAADAESPGDHESALDQRLAEQRGAIESELRALVQSAPDAATAGQLEQLAEGLTDLDRKRSAAAAVVTPANQLQAYARALFAQQWMTALVHDTIALDSVMSTLQQQRSQWHQARVDQQIDFIARRLKSIAERHQQHRDVLSDAMLAAADRWDQATGQWIDAAGTAEVTHAGLLETVDRMLSSGQPRYALRLALQQVHGQITTLADSIRALNRFGAQAAAAPFAESRDRLLQRLTASGEFHARHPKVDLQFVADLHQVRRAIENVTRDGWGSLADQPPAVPLDRLAGAVETLHAAHQLVVLQNELRETIAAEIELTDVTSVLVDHPIWLQRSVILFASATDQMGRAELGRAELGRAELGRADLGRTDRGQMDRGQLAEVPDDAGDPASDSFRRQVERADELMAKRTIVAAPILSASAPWEQIEQTVGRYLAASQPRILAARQIVAEYVKSLSEQTREAVQAVKQAEDRAREHAAEELQQAFVDADAATQSTMQSLVDFANTRPTDQPDSLELARDADAALAEIDRQVRRTRESVGQAATADEDSLDRAADQLGQLREQLQTTAAHFEAAARGEDVAQSRQQLRNPAASSAQSQEIDQLHQRARALAEAANRSPDDLKDQLEQAIKSDSAAQQELSDLARRTTQSALAALRQAAAEERHLSQSIERSSPELAEHVQRLAATIDDIAARLESVRGAVVDSLSRVIDAPLMQDQRHSLERAADQLQDAARQGQAVRQNGTDYRSLRYAAESMRQQLRNAKRSAEELLLTEAEVDQFPIPSRNQVARQRANMLRIFRTVREQRIKIESQTKSRWQTAHRSATRRVQTATRQLHDNEQALSQLEQQEAAANLAQRESLMHRVTENRRAIDAAQRTMEIAQQKVQQADTEIERIKAQPIEPIESKRAAAEGIQRLAPVLIQEIDQAVEALQPTDRMPAIENLLELSEPFARELAARQRTIHDDVDRIGNDLRRSALHEQRLHREDSARQLAESAARVKAIAGDSVSAAMTALQQATADAEQTAAGYQHLGEAAMQIEHEADALAQLLAQPDQPQAQPDRPTGADPSKQQRGEQLAQTLDDLDRAAGGDQPDGEQTAGEVSPTLSGAMADAARQAADERRERMAASAGQSGDKPGEGKAAGQSQQSGGGTGADQGTLPFDSVDRRGADWGFLRQQSRGDVSGTGAETVPFQYRRAIEAYFRVLAERSAEEPK